MEDERFRPTGPPRAARLDPWWGVHAARYVLARPLVAGPLVVDIACGTAYGLDLLAPACDLVVGVDVSFAAASEAARRGHAAVNASASELPAPTSSIPAVTSFETLEHLHDRDGFLDELSRVLRPDGVLVLSTPNARQTRPVNGVPRNPHHVHEYEPDELAAALEGRFASVELLGQVRRASFRTPPFQDEQLQLPRSPAVRARTVAYRAAAKAPAALREIACRALTGRAFYPGEDDYELRAEHAADAPVLVAICRLPR